MALILLNKALGAANTIRFLSMYNTGNQDYMGVRGILHMGSKVVYTFQGYGRKPGQNV